VPTTHSIGHLMAATAPTKAVQSSIKQVRASVRGKVHKSVLVRVNNICNLVEQVLPRAVELGVGSEELHVLTRMATEYLPSAINPYLQLPRDYAERVRLSDGRTAIYILCAQLDVMYAQTWNVVDAVARSDGDKLMANERFLEDKFGHNPLNIPPQEGPSGSAPASSQRGGTTPTSSAPTLSRQVVQAVARHLIDLMRSRRKS
jgi:hypothetical protein